jgi:hypothetical protein
VISVVIPVRGDVQPPDRFYERLNEGDASREVLLASSTPVSESVRRFAGRCGGQTLESNLPRGARLREAARQARGEILLFLHADTVLPSGWASAIEAAITCGSAGGAFRLAFDTMDPRLRLVAFWANIRTSLTRVPYGDQAPFVQRAIYEELDGHAPWPLLEDVEFGTRLRGQGKVEILASAVETSGSRYRQRGVVRNVLSNWAILLRYHLGASPEDLARRYRS